MRTAIFIVAGLLVLVMAVLIGRAVSGPHMMNVIAKAFIALWLAIALINMWMGVAKAGYTVAEEFPIFLVIFMIPAALAAVIIWKF